MDNPRANLTDTERQYSYDCAYIYWLVYSSAASREAHPHDPTMRLWFRDISDRAAFRRLLAALPHDYQFSEGMESH